MYLLKQANYNR